jgi:hypothetical protein
MTWKSLAVPALMLLAFHPSVATPAPLDLNQLKSPILFQGDSGTAFRDPAAVYSDGIFHLYFTRATIDPDGTPYQQTAWSKSSDLITWTTPVPFTPKDRNLNYGSPGSVIKVGDDWILCLQTYPRPNGEEFGNQDSRIWTMRGKDLEHWGPAEPIMVKGPDVPLARMGRVIDPCLFPDKDTPGKWWCSYKQHGMSLSWSTDLKTWHPIAPVNAGENTCIIIDHGEYVLFHSPANGVGVKRSGDLKTWRDLGTIYLGQKDWPWAQGRLTAGFVLDLRQDPGVARALMFFHGEYPKSKGGFDNYASIGIAWSDDLIHWSWPGATNAVSPTPSR